MTAPQPYPGDPGTDPAAPIIHFDPPGPFRREFYDALDRPLDGGAVLRSDRGSVSVPIVDGVLEVSLVPGAYHLLATLEGPDGAVSYRSEDFEVTA